MIRLLLASALLPLVAIAGPSEALSEGNALFAKRDWKQTAEFFARQDFREWPEKQRLEALRLKAVAETFAKMGAEAEATLREAIRLQPMSADWWLLLGDNYKLNFTDKAAEEMNAHQEALRLSGSGMGWQRFTAALAVARHHTDEVRGDDALKVLQVFDAMPDVPPSWRVRLLHGQAHALASLGRDAEAMAKFREALALEEKK